MATLCPSCFGQTDASGWCDWCGPQPPESEPQDLPIGTRVAERYQIGRTLGRGGFGITYVAWRLDTGERVAIKEYLPQSIAVRDRHSNHVIPAARSVSQDFTAGLDDFLAEARRLAMFRGQPSIISVIDYVEAHGTGYLAMEFCPGVTAEQLRVQRGGKLPFDEALRVMLPVLDALEVVHAEHVYHRDVSPENILVPHNGPVKLLDFGSARAALSGRSQVFSAIVRIDYTPPEQYGNDASRQGPWTDVYAAAATLYHLATGVKPPQPIERHERDYVKPPHEIDPSIPQTASLAILRGLALAPRARTQTAAQFRKELTEAAPVAKSTSTARWVLAGLAMFLVSAIALGGVAYWIGQQILEPKIVTFNASPGTVVQGQPVTLTWQTQHADRVSLTPETGNSLAANYGSMTVTPSESLTYTLVAYRGSKQVTETRTVTVEIPPPPPPPPPPPLTPAQLDGQRLIDFVNSQGGYRPWFDPIYGELNDDGEKIWDATEMRPNAEYWVLAGGDNDIEDIDLTVSTVGGTPLVTETEVKHYSGVRFRAPADGAAKITMKMWRCKANPCRFVILGYVEQSAQ